MSSNFGPKHFAAAAHYSINGTGTPAFYGNFNCSSVTDNGTGFHRPNLTNALANNDFSVGACSGESATISGLGSDTPTGTNSIAHRTNNWAGSATDSPNLDGIVMGVIT